MEMLSVQEEKERKAKSYKMLLWFAMISIVMVFAGLTSAFVISKSRPDWVSDLIVPNAFVVSTVVLLVSSVTFHLAKLSIRKDDRSKTTLFLLITLALAIVFIVCQFKGFNELFANGFVPTGSTGTITVSFLYAFVIMHIAHLVGGTIALLIIIYNHFKQKYNSTQTLGIELGAMFWHFLDFLWVYLFLFFYFYK
ncbi:heme-copper oxidase subunit III [Flavobacterium sp.]|uniref:cytochrome c oxidase subunit 3 n=1 Tax=Flavobacterium sp. TaxID=239 RepID=UPI0028BECBA3|nr:cytochrome c oxidase subunit 3 [Flavobacterium sp.]